jgi:hypothetical protein
MKIDSAKTQCTLDLDTLKRKCDDDISECKRAKVAQVTQEQADVNGA